MPTLILKRSQIVTEISLEAKDDGEYSIFETIYLNEKIISANKIFTVKNDGTISDLKELIKKCLIKSEQA